MNTGLLLQSAHFIFFFSLQNLAESHSLALCEDTQNACILLDLTFVELRCGEWGDAVKSMKKRRGHKQNMLRRRWIGVNKKYKVLGGCRRECTAGMPSERGADTLFVNEIYDPRTKGAASVWPAQHLCAYQEGPWSGETSRGGGQKKGGGLPKGTETDASVSSAFGGSFDLLSTPRLCHLHWKMISASLLELSASLGLMGTDKLWRDVGRYVWIDSYASQISQCRHECMQSGRQRTSGTVSPLSPPPNTHTHTQTHTSLFNRSQHVDKWLLILFCSLAEAIFVL